jgi:hypothetical protein
MALDPEELVTLTDQWHYETALSSSESHDVATQAAEAGDNRPTRRTSDLEFRADQESCGAVG